MIDRQGKPVPNVKAFHSGDGPAQTAVTDADGRFRLNGIPAGTVFVFARSDGFRFHGQLLKAGDREITVVLSRTGEHPERELERLPERVPIDESRHGPANP